MKGVISFIAALLFLTAGVGAQTTCSLTGIVVDSATGAPIPGATVSLANSGCATVSDHSGNFQFRSLPPGAYQLEATVVGYHSRVVDDLEIKAGVTLSITIRIAVKLHLIPGQTVRGIHERDYTGAPEIIDRQEIQSQSAGNLTEILSQVEGVQIESDGRAGSNTRIRIRGSETNQVLVLLDGHRLAPSSSGSVNLDAIPVEAVQEIQVHRGGASARFGPDALGGVINIVTRTASSIRTRSGMAGLSAGGDGMRREEMSLETPAPWASGSLRMALQNERSRGDYSFSYSVEPTGQVTKGVRANNASDSRSFFLAYSQPLGGAVGIHSTWHWYGNSSGLPGRADRQNRYASREDQRLQGHLDFTWAGDDASLDLRAGFSRQDQEYADTQSVSGTYHTHHKVDRYDFGAEYRNRLPFEFAATTGMAAEFDRMQQEDVLRPSPTGGSFFRRNLGLFAMIRRTTPLSFLSSETKSVVDLSLRQDWSRSWPETPRPATPFSPVQESSESRSLSPRLGLVLSTGTKLAMSVRADVGRSYRLPSLTSLFWSGDVRSQGNPALRPEKSLHRELGFEISWTGSVGMIRARSTFFRNDVEDLVVWVEGSQAVWKPINLGKADIRGHEDMIEWTSPGDVVSIRFANEVTQAVNQVPGHNAFGKDLIFRPRFTTSLQTRIQYGWFHASHSVRRVARRFALEGNEKWYSGYTVHDMSVGCEMPIHRYWRVKTNWQLRNGSDEQYVLVAHDPMPDRSHNFNLRITYLLEREK